MTQASNSAAKCSIHQRFLNIHHTYFIGQSMTIFVANLFPSWSMPSLNPSQLCFPARLSLLLCDFYLKIKKKPRVTRLITVLCLCPSILHNCRMQDVDHVLRKKHLGAADMSHPADLSHVRYIGWKGLGWPANLSHMYTIIWQSASHCFVTLDYSFIILEKTETIYSHAQLVLLSHSLGANHLISLKLLF